MNKDEILEKAKKENLINDEAKNNKGKTGKVWGFSASIAVWIVFTTLYYLYEFVKNASMTSSTKQLNRLITKG